MRFLIPSMLEILPKGLMRYDCVSVCFFKIGGSHEVCFEFTSQMSCLTECPSPRWLLTSKPVTRRYCCGCSVENSFLEVNPVTRKLRIAAGIFVFFKSKWQHTYSNIWFRKPRSNRKTLIVCWNMWPRFCHLIMSIDNIIREPCLAVYPTHVTDSSYQWFLSCFNFVSNLLITLCVGLGIWMCDCCNGTEIRGKGLHGACDYQEFV